jgi:hypothetical protein
LKLNRYARWVTALLVVVLSSISAPQAFADDLQNPVIVADSGVASSSTPAPSESFTVTYRVTDDVGCCGYHQAWLYNAAGTSLSQVTPALVSGTATDGTFRASFTMPANAASGTYTVKAQATDLTGKYTHLQLLATLTVGSGAVTPPSPSPTPPSSSPTPQPTDSENPVVVVGSGQVSVPSTTPGASLYLTYQVTDDLDCCDYHQAWLYDSTGTSVNQVTPIRISGDNRNGSYKATFTVPSNGSFGTYIMKAQATDKAGKYTHLQLLGSVVVSSTTSAPVPAPAPAPVSTPSGSPSPTASPTPTVAPIVAKPVTNLAAPKSLSATRVAAGKTLLVWSAPALASDQTITSYRLQYRLKTATVWKTLTVKTRPFVVLSGLVSKKTYSVRIAAVSGQIVSKNLLSKEFTTK